MRDKESKEVKAVADVCVSVRSYSSVGGVEVVTIVFVVY